MKKLVVVFAIAYGCQYKLHASWFSFKAGPSRASYHFDEGQRIQPSLLWRWQLPDSDGLVALSSPISDGNRVFFGDTKGNVVALDAANGGEPSGILWTFPTSAPIFATPAFDSEPAVEGSVYVPSMNGNFYALNAQTGQLRWRQAIDGGAMSSPLVFSAAEGKRVVIASTNGKVYLMDASTGQVVWVHKVQDYYRSSPVLSFSGNLILAVSASGILSAIHLSTGLVAWTKELGATQSTPLSLDSGIFAIDRNGALVILKENGDVVTYGYPLGGRAISSPVGKRESENRTLIFAATAQGNVVARRFWIDPGFIAADVWSVQLPAGVYGTPALTDTALFVPALNGLVYVMDPLNGSILGEISAANGTVGEMLPARVSPAVSERRLLIGNSGGYLAAFQVESPEPPCLGCALWCSNFSADPIGAMPAGWSSKGTPGSLVRVQHPAGSDNPALALSPEGGTAIASLEQGNYLDSELSLKVATEGRVIGYLRATYSSEGVMTDAYAIHVWVENGQRKYIVEFIKNGVSSFPGFNPSNLAGPGSLEGAKLTFKATGYPQASIGVQTQETAAYLWDVEALPAGRLALGAQGSLAMADDISVNPHCEFPTMTSTQTWTLTPTPSSTPTLTATPTYTQTPSCGYRYAMNCGSTGMPETYYSNAEEVQYQAMKLYGVSGASFGMDNSTAGFGYAAIQLGTIYGTSEPEIYQSYVSHTSAGNSLRFLADLTPGRYRVKLKFTAETNNTPFDISAEGQVLASGFNPESEASQVPGHVNGQRWAVDRPFDFYVLDGRLELDLIAAPGQWVSLSGVMIECVTEGTPTLTETLSFTDTASPSGTPSDTPTLTATQTATPSPSDSPTLTFTSTYSLTPTYTWTLTSSPSPSATPPIVDNFIDLTLNGYSNCSPVSPPPVNIPVYRWLDPGDYRIFPVPGSAWAYAPNSQYLSNAFHWGTASGTESSPGVLAFMDGMGVYVSNGVVPYVGQKTFNLGSRTLMYFIVPDTACSDNSWNFAIRIEKLQGTPTPVAAPSPSVCENFEGAGNGFSAGHWGLREGGSAQLVAAPSGMSGTALKLDGGAGLAYLANNQWSSLDTDFRVRASGNRSIIVARLSGGPIVGGGCDNCYTFDIDRVAALARMYRVMNRTPVLISQVSISVGSGSSYDMRFVLQGSHLTGYYNGVQAGDIPVDPTPLMQPGSVALLGYYGVSYFDNVSVNAPDCAFDSNLALTASPWSAYACSVQVGVSVAGFSNVASAVQRPGTDEYYAIPETGANIVRLGAGGAMLGSTAHGVGAPRGLAVQGNKLYVAGSNTILNEFTINADGSLAYVRGVSGINMPHGMKVDAASNRLYIAQYNPSRVAVVNLASLALEQTLGAGILVFNATLDLAIDPIGLELYVTDVDRIRVLDIAPGANYGSQKRSLGGSGGIHYSGVDFDAALNRLYALDQVTDTIRAYDPLTGARTGVFGSTGEAAGGFQWPTMLRRAEDGRLIVSDYWRSRIQLIRPDCITGGGVGGAGGSALRSAPKGEEKKSWLGSSGRTLVSAPNPASDRCEAFFKLEQSAKVRLTLANVAGDIVLREDLGEMAPGEHRQGLNVAGFASGVYFLVMETHEGAGWKVKARFKTAIAR